MLEERDPEIISMIEKLRSVPERSPQMAATGRAKFLAEAQMYQPAVSRRSEGRHIEWKTIFSRKAYLNMATLSTLILIFVFLFGGGATVYAAQGSLPDQALYFVKLASEDIRASLPASSRSHANLEINFADLRLQEALQLAAQDKPIPAKVWDRMEKHIDLGLHAATDLDNGQLRQQLLLIQSRLNAELQKSSQLTVNRRYGSDAQRVRMILRINLQVVLIGLADPTAFRAFVRSEHHSGWQPVTPVILTPTISATPQPTQLTETPWPTQTPISRPNDQAQPNNDHHDDNHGHNHDNHHNGGCCH